jgi:hypothetical protein
MSVNNLSFALYKLPEKELFLDTGFRRNNGNANFVSFFRHTGESRCPVVLKHWLCQVRNFGK